MTHSNADCLNEAAFKRAFGTASNLEVSNFIATVTITGGL